jgi:hypothetical protein
VCWNLLEEQPLAPIAEVLYEVMAESVLGLRYQHIIGDTCMTEAV